MGEWLAWLWFDPAGIIVWHGGVLLLMIVASEAIERPR